MNSAESSSKRICNQIIKSTTTIVIQTAGLTKQFVLQGIGNTLRTLVAGICCLFLTLTANAENPTDVETILKDSQESAFSLSPDASIVGFMRWTPSGYYFVMHNTEDGEWINEVPFGKSRPTTIDWLASKRIIYSRNWEVFVMNMDGTDHKRILSRFDSDRSGGLRKRLRSWKILHLLPDDPEHILAQSWNSKVVPAVVRVNLYTGEEKELVFEPKLKIDHWVVDRDGDVRFGIRYRKDELEILGKDPQSGKWVVFDDYELDGRNTLGHTGETYLSKRVSLEGFDYNDDRFYMAINHNTDRFRMVEYDVPTKSIVREVLADSRFDVGGPEQDSTRLLFDDGIEKLIGLRYAAEKPKTVWFDEGMKAIQAEIDGRRPEHYNQIIAWSADRTTILVRSSSATDPGRHTIFHPGSGRHYTFSIDNQGIEASEMAATEAISFAARDDHLIDGYMTIGKSEPGAAKRLIVMPHGGPFRRDHLEFDSWAQVFATRGYSVLRLNYRGSTGYGREHLLAGIKNLDSLMIDDIADGARWAVENDYAARNQVYIFGHSYGGYAALMSAARYPDTYQAAVAWAAPVDLLGQLKHYKKEDFVFAYEYWKTAAGDPRKEKATLKRISPLNNVDALELPILIFHGQNDSTVPEEFTKDYEKALRKAGNEADVIIFDDEGHNFRNNDNVAYILNRSMRFFEQVSE